MKKLALSIVMAVVFAGSSVYAGNTDKTKQADCCKKEQACCKEKKACCKK